MTSGPIAARWFRVIATFEAISWTALLIAMFLKHVVDAPHEGGVPVVGMIHGIGFVVYLVSTVWAAVRLRWSWKVTLVGLAASIPPLFTLLFERWLVRHDRLAPQPGIHAAPARG